MGWGCYKHEMDAGSEAWTEKLDALCDKKLAEGKPTWGRDGQICPACWEELEKERDLLQAHFRDLRQRVDDLEAERASLLDLINQELRENGPLDVPQARLKDSPKKFVRMLVDLVRARAHNWKCECGTINPKTAGVCSRCGGGNF